MAYLSSVSHLGILHASFLVQVGQQKVLPIRSHLPLREHLKTKNQKRENLPQTKKPSLVADFSLDHTGGWGGVSGKIVIENFMVIK